MHDLIVIGAGPGGYVAAIRAAQLGFDVACVEKESALGGTCLRIGCIPSKALLESSELYHAAHGELGAHGVRVSGVELDLGGMMKRKRETVERLTRGVAGLFEKKGVRRYEGHARIVSPGEVVIESADGGEETTVETKRILIATGSVPSSIPGVEIDHGLVGDSTDALGWDAVPEHLVVIGAGVIGLELGSVWARLGAKVTVLEYLDRILPGMDTETATHARKILAKQGLEFLLGQKVTGVDVDGGDVAVVHREGQDDIRADRVLCAVGRKPSTAGLGLEDVGVELDDRGRVTVDDEFRTSVEGIYAIGDVIRGPMLAHKAEDEGIACVEGILSGHVHVNYDAIPSVVYTSPEIASVGKTEEELEEAGIPYRKGEFPYRANGRALVLGDTSGRVKMLAHAETDRVLGVHIVGVRAGDLIAEAAAAIEFGASSEDIARTPHAHPTLAEVVKEAALAVDERAIHF